MKAVILLLISLGIQCLAQVKPFHAGAFSSFVGVNTHLQYIGYNNNSFHPNLDLYEKVVFPALTSLKIGHIREGLKIYSNSPPIQVLLVYGMDVNYKVHNSTDSPWSPYFLPFAQALLQGGNVFDVFGVNVHVEGNVLFTLEGPNEVDHCASFLPGCSHSDPGDWFYKSLLQNPNWPWETTDVVSAAHQVGKQLGLNTMSPSFTQISPPYTSGTTSWSQETYSGKPLNVYMEPIKSFYDLGNMHIYPGGFRTSDVVNSLGTNIQWYSGKPIWVTECGYSTPVPNGNGYNKAQVENVQAKAVIRNIFDFKDMGFAGVFLYELLDDQAAPTAVEAAYGLFRSDGSPKPVATAITNIMTLFEDYTAFTLVWLNFTISDPKNIKVSLFQNSAGDYFMAVRYDTAILTPDGIGQNTFQATISWPQKLNVYVYHPWVQRTPVSTYTNVNSVSMAFPDSVIILRLSSGIGGDAEIKPPNGNITIQNTNTNPIQYTDTANYGIIYDPANVTNIADNEISSSQRLLAFLEFILFVTILHVILF